jgi:hypothetical protein
MGMGREVCRRHHEGQADTLRRADAVYIEEIRKAGLYDTIRQAFAALLPVKTVGVMGGGRTYEYVVGLRAVTSTDGMTADFYLFDVKFLGATATRITNEVKGVNRAEFAGGHLVRVMRPWRVVPAWRNSAPQLRPAGCLSIGDMHLRGWSRSKDSGCRGVSAGEKAVRCGRNLL